MMYSVDDSNSDSASNITISLSSVVSSGDARRIEDPRSMPNGNTSEFKAYVLSRSVDKPEQMQCNLHHVHQNQMKEIWIKYLRYFVTLGRRIFNRQ